MKRIVLGIGLVLALANLAAGEPSDLGPTLRAVAEKYKLPGTVGAILGGDRIVALGSTGVRKIGSPEPFLSTDVIHLGSDTKAMTAMLIGQLIDQKRIAFDSTMREAFPDLAGKMDRQMARVTVRDLLDHDAGLPHDIDWGKFEAMNESMMARRRRAVEEALSAPPASPIGSFSYSNVGYVILGAIVEAKTGTSWEEAIRRDIFEPLHMDSAGFGPPGTEGKIDEPWGHILNDGKLEAVHSDNPAVMGPAGRVHCSIEDWAKFIAETLKGARGHPTLVSAETFRKLTTPMAGQQYAGGWGVVQRDWAGGVAMTHAGSNTTWYCNVWIAPNKDFAVLWATNYGSEPVAKAADEGVGELIKLNARLGEGK